MHLHSFTCMSFVHMQVIWKHLFCLSSNDQHGTLLQLKNLIHRNVVMKNNTNATENFFHLVVSSYIVAAAMNILQIADSEDTGC